MCWEGGFIDRRSVDIFQLSPGFRTAVFNVHSVLMGVALVVVFGGLVQKITDAQRGRNVGRLCQR